MKENLKKKSEEKNDHLDKLQATIRSLGVSFDVWGKRNEDGKGSGQHDFTSLLGSDKKKLLKDLPDKLKECIHLKTCQEVKDIPVWESFHELYKIITNINYSNTPFDQYFEMARKWVIKFTSLREKQLGSTRAAITPYIHTMVYTYLSTKVEPCKTVYWAGSREEQRLS